MHSLNFELLDKVRHRATGKITARCPACAEIGGDRGGNHLVVFPNGKFACAAWPGDGEHRRRINALAGLPVKVQSQPIQGRGHNEHRCREQLQRYRANRLLAAARDRRNDVFEKFAWTPADVWENSPQRIDTDLVSHCPRHFLASLFHGEAIVWTGELHETGKAEYTRCWKTCADWGSNLGTVGPMTTPAIWAAGTSSRSAMNCIGSPFTVLDFDGLDGDHPVTADDHFNHLCHSLATIRWLREAHYWQLGAIVHTGNKSLHAWFHTPIPSILASLRNAAPALGIDTGLIGRPEHPCRLPGQAHRLTQRRSRVLWLQIPTPDQ